jgi:cytochrome b involved in lipid metabolism
LYDLTNFVDRHPGGQEWISLTKGIDITEMFETHHVTDKAEQLLGKYFVRDAKLPRNYKITFKADGFYRTLKKRVSAAMSDLDYRPKKKSEVESLI